jgi:hypothetical protein
MTITLLQMNKKTIIGAVCAIALFAGGAVVGAQINASASSNAIATLPLSKGGTEATTAGAAATSILGTDFGNYTGGILPASKGGTGINGALSTAISSASTNLQIPTAKAVYDRAPKIQSGSFTLPTTTQAYKEQAVVLNAGFTANPMVYIEFASTPDYWTAISHSVKGITKTGFTARLYNDSSISVNITCNWTAIGY